MPWFLLGSALRTWEPVIPCLWSDTWFWSLYLASWGGTTQSCSSGLYVPQLLPLWMQLRRPGVAERSAGSAPAPAADPAPVDLFVIAALAAVPAVWRVTLTSGLEARGAETGRRALAAAAISGRFWPVMGSKEARIGSTLMPRPVAPCPTMRLNCFSFTAS